MSSGATGSENHTPAPGAALAAIADTHGRAFAAVLAGPAFVVLAKVSGLHRHVHDVSLLEVEVVVLSPIISKMACPRQEVVETLPFKAFLSSSILPRMISRMLVGAAGRGSHSFRQSVQINSFNLYPLKHSGSNCPLEPFGSVFRFLRYFSSILYGCLWPVVSMRVMLRTGPVAAEGTLMGFSVAGPRASVCIRVNAGADFGCSEAAVVGCEGVGAAADVPSSSAGCAVDCAGST